MAPRCQPQGQRISRLFRKRNRRHTSIVKISESDSAEGGGRASLFVSLPKPPSATQLTVRKLISRVQEGAIRVPAFQRPLRWREDDVVKLFDSILKGYPIGSILFWKHPLEATSQLLVGSAKMEAPAHSDGWYIVDGQQRVTALAAALLDLDHHGDTRWEIWFDPAANAFHAGAPSAEQAGKVVPLKALGDLRRLGRWLQQCTLSEDQQTRVEEVQQRLLDYEIPGYVVDTDNVDALRGVFARMNSTGVRMRADEVFQALLGQGGGGADPRKRGVDLMELQRAADLDGFGEPPRAEVLKALLAMSDLDPLKRLEELGESAVEQLVDGSDALEAIGRATSFLQARPDAAEPGAGIPAYAFIPYPVVFVILARWFHLFPEPDEATRRALATWLWRGVATAVHQRAAVSALRLQIREIKADDMAGSLTRLLAAVGEPKSSEWSTLDPFHANHAASRVELLALLTREPLDRSGPVSFRALLSSGERVAREIFSVARFEEGSLRRLARTAANRVLLDARHTNLASEFRQWTWDRDRAALESHLIDRDGFEGLCRGEYAKVLEGRAARLRSLVSSFLSQRVGFGQPRVLPVEAYYDSLDAVHSVAK